MPLLSLTLLLGTAIGSPSAQAEPPVEPVTGTSHKWIPWLELNSLETDVDSRPGVRRLDHGLEGLKAWEHVTDTIIITTVHYRVDDLYPLLVQRKSARTFLIGGVKSSRLLPPGRFDDAQGWRRIADVARRISDITRTNVVVLECEGALRPFYVGEATIDLEALSSALRPLAESGVHVWWWGLGAVKNSADVPDREDQSMRLAATVAAAVPDSSFLNAERGMLTPSVLDVDGPRRRQRMFDLVGRKRLIDLAYVHLDRQARGFTYEFYTPADLLRESARFTSPAVVIYPGEADWLNVARMLSRSLEHGQTEPSPQP